MMKEDRGGCGADDLATEANSQVVANRKNAKRSTGPRTAPGKATSSQNAIRHGLLSSKMLLNDEDPAEFDALLLDLHRSLNPVGVIELALAERIAVSLWRQSRLIAAEAAEITLERRAGAVAKAVGRLEDLGLSWEIGPGALLPVDEDDVAWCEAVIAEVLAGNELSMANLRDKAPTIHEALVCEAEDDEETPERFIEQFPEGLTSYVSQPAVHCLK